MTMNNLSLKYAYFCKTKFKNISPTVVDIGSQTPTFNIESFEKKISKIETQNKNQLNAINNIRNNKQIIAKDVYIALGYKNYQSIDIHGAYDSHKFDLNSDIEETYDFKDQFDLTISNGTGEHIFNQFSLYKNIHNLTKENGLMLSILPFYGWVNHGFYNYHPIFFADMAASNDYELVRMSFANRNGNEIFLKDGMDTKILFTQLKPNRPPNHFSNLIAAAIEKLGDNISIVCVYRKLSNDKFKIPLQGKYLNDVKNFDTEYKSQKGGSENAEGQISDNNKRNNKSNF